MTDIKTVLTDEQIIEIYQWSKDTPGISFADEVRHIEAAVLAASAPAQEPVAVIELKKCRGPRKFQFRLLGDFFPEKETPLYAAPVDAQDAVDAKRWREMLLHVGGRLHHDLGQIFTITYVKPVAGANIMRGGVSEHFTQAIDAILQASQSPQDQAAVKE